MAKAYSPFTDIYPQTHICARTHTQHKYIHTSHYVTYATTENATTHTNKLFGFRCDCCSLTQIHCNIQYTHVYTYTQPVWTKYRHKHTHTYVRSNKRKSAHTHLFFQSSSSSYTKKKFSKWLPSNFSIPIRWKCEIFFVDRKQHRKKFISQNCKTINSKSYRSFCKWKQSK